MGATPQPHAGTRRGGAGPGLQTPPPLPGRPATPGTARRAGDVAHARRLLVRQPPVPWDPRGRGSGMLSGLAAGQRAPPPTVSPSPRAARGARWRRAPASRGISPPARPPRGPEQLSPARPRATPDRAGAGVRRLAQRGLTFSDVSLFSASAFGPEWPALRKEKTHINGRADRPQGPRGREERTPRATHLSGSSSRRSGSGEGGFAAAAASAAATREPSRDAATTRSAGQEEAGTAPAPPPQLPLQLGAQQDPPPAGPAPAPPPPTRWGPDPPRCPSRATRTHLHPPA